MWLDTAVQWHPAGVHRHELTLKTQIRFGKMNTKQRKRLFRAVIVLALLVMALLPIWLARGKPLYVAVVGPMSGPTQDDGRDMARGIQLYLDELNAQGGINGRPVKLRIYDDQNDPEQAQAIAQEIAANDQILLVLGHMFSSTSLAAAPVYQQAEIPAITASATAEAITAGNPFYFRVIANGHDQGAFLANYAFRIMGEPVASIIYDEDAFGRSVQEAFANTFRGLGGEVRYTWHFDNKSPTLADDLTQITADIVRANERPPGIILLATHVPEARELIVQMRRQGVTLPLLGPTSLGNPRLTEQFADLPEEVTQPGFFLDNLYAVTPILFDVAGEEAQHFYDQYTRHYGSAPGLKAVGYYDAAKMGLTAVQQANISGQPQTIAADRQKIRDALAAMNTPVNSVTGLTGPLFFNRQGDLVKPMFVGTFAQQRFIAALTQLQPVVDLTRIPDLAAEIDAGRILIVDGQYMYRTDVVQTGIEIIRVNRIDTSQSRYQLDFYLWLRHRPDVDAANIEFLNSVSPLTLGDPIKEELTDVLHYRLWRVKAEFEGDFDYHQFPFDRQPLAVELRHKTLLHENLIYVVDELGLRQTSQTAVLERLQRSNAFDAINNWRVNGVLHYTDSLHSESTLGDPHFLRIGETPLTYSQFNTVLFIERNAISFVIKNLLPLIIIISLAYVVFYIPIQTLAPRIIISVNALLTTAFFHLRLANDLPGIGYLIALDYLFYGTYLLIGMQLSLTVWANQAKEQGNEVLVDRLNRTGRVAYPVVIVIGAIAWIWLFDPALPAAWHNLWDGVGETAVAANPVVIPENDTNETTTLTLASWRVEDSAQMNRILDAFHQQYPDITIQFEPMVATRYNDTIRAQLANGTAADLLYLRSFTLSQQLYEAGYLEPLADLPGLTENFAPASLEPWMGEDDMPYGVPFIATSHAIYYNQDIFAELGITPPQTWEELLAAAQTVQDAGYIPFANGSGEPWTVAELVFMNLAPNFIGGREGRLAYLRGERCFDDAAVVAAFTAVADLAPFFPKNHAELTYGQSMNLFTDGKAAMRFGGSWDIPYLETAVTNFNWSVFATPPPAGQPGYITFHPDVAIGLNTASPHKEAARTFLTWLTTPEAITLMSNELPGFFPLHKQTPEISNPHARAFLALNEGRGQDIRWAWQSLMAKIPSGYTLMQDGALDVLNGEIPPTEAAANLQSGLAQWFEPAQRCR